MGSALDSELKTLDSRPDQVIVMCSLARFSTVEVALPTKLDEIKGFNWRLTSVASRSGGEVEIPLSGACHANRDNF